MITINLYGEIGSDVNVGDIVRRLQAAKGEPVTLRINSIGGDLMGGIAIYNLLRTMSGVTAVIDGVAASVASIVMLGADRVEMPENAWIMTHNVSAKLDGTAEDFRETADLLERSDQQLIDIYVRETGKPLEAVRQWMAGETWFSAEEALAAGFVDQISDKATLLNLINLDRFAKVPEAVRNSFNQARRNESMKVLIAGLVKSGLVDCACMSAQAPDEQAIANEVASSVEELTAENAALKEKVAALESQLAEYTAKQQDTVKARATVAIEAAISDGRIPPSIKDTMVAAYVADEAAMIKNLSDIKVRSGTGPGTQPVTRGATGDHGKSVKDRVAAESDPKKRIELSKANWGQLIEA